MVADLTPRPDGPCAPVMLAPHRQTGYDAAMQHLKVRVENGKIVGQAPPGVPDGTELELCLADPGDDMTDEELAALNRAMEAAWRSVTEGRARPAADVISDLRARR